LVLRLIRSLADAPSSQDWDEVWEQVSHQWSGYSIAFAAIPHLIQLGIRQDLTTDPGFLLGLGRTIDSLASLGPPPPDLRSDFEAALRAVSPAVKEATKATGYSRENYLCVLHAAAALSGRRGLGTELLFCVFASGPGLDCPRCKAYLSGEFEESGLAFQSINSHMQPLSKKAWVRLRKLGRGSSKDSHPAEDFMWLAWLCRAAKQKRLLSEISFLYGTLVCPLCGTEIIVMSEIMRRHVEVGVAAD